MAEAETPAPAALPASQASPTPPVPPAPSASVASPVSPAGRAGVAGLRDRLVGLLSQDEWKALGVCAALAALFIHDWDGFVFERTVRDLWAGVTPYETGREAPWYSLLGPSDHHPQWYAYPPLPLLLMAGSFAPAVWLDLPEAAQRLLLKLPMVLAHLALARAIAAAARHAAPAGAAADAAAARAHRAALWNPFLVLVGPIWGMTDPMMMAFVLGGVLAFVRGRTLLAGLLLGGALLVKPFPALLAIPLLAWAWPRFGARRIAAAGAVAGAAALSLALPFLLAEPAGFLQQVGGAHLQRGAQGLTFWRWPGFHLLSPAAIQVASMALLAAGLGVASLWSSRREGRAAPFEALLAGAVPILLLNRVVNEQYFAMAVVPVAILAASSPRWERVGKYLTWTLTAAVVLTGFHFLTFIPPDVALLVLRRPTDEVAHLLRTWVPYFWDVLAKMFLYVVPPLLVWLGLQLRAAGRAAPPAATPPAGPARGRAAARAWPSLALCVLLAGAGIAAPAQVAPEEATFVPRHAQPQVSAFYYLWWNNPAHDPDTLYGNWLKVSQHPDIGYYTNNRGIAQLHARQMVENGIDTAIVSYHRGEQERYRVFQEEAAREGLWVAPLIELNQVYDMVVDGRRVHRPIDENGREAPYAAYRLSQGAQDEIVHFVLDLKQMLARPNQLRIDGRPVVLFYDAYVSGVSFHGEDRDRLAQAVVDLFDVADLRRHYDDPTLQPDYVDVLRYHPIAYEEFFGGPRAAPWRAAHLHAHSEFWASVQGRVEAETGPLFWISGDAYNDRAGFEAGTVQSLNNLESFDGSFIYSPSFTWGTNRERPFEEVFAKWEDRNHWMEAFSNAKGRLAVVGIAPAYDDTVNRPDVGFVIPDAHGGVSTYDRSWNSVLATRPGWVAIATWNEFFEGSSIEPDTVRGDAWLRATRGFRPMLAEAPDEPAVAFLVPEWQSRLHWRGVERDEPHIWAMDLIAGGVRAFPGHEPYAFDFEEAWLAPFETPDALLVEGGHGFYNLSAFVRDRIAAWRADGMPLAIFGPGEAEPLRELVPAACLAVDDPGNVTLEPGDRLWQDGDSLWLDRSGVPEHSRGTSPSDGSRTSPVDGSLTFRVGRSCDGVGFASFKPYGSDSSVLDAQCLRVAAVLVGRATADECVVPLRPNP